MTRSFGNLDISEEDIMTVLRKLQIRYYVIGGKAMSKYIKIKSLDWDLEIEAKNNDQSNKILLDIIKELQYISGKKIVFNVFDGNIFRIKVANSKKEDPYFMDIKFVKNIDKELYIDIIDGIPYLNIHSLYLNITKGLKIYEDMLNEFDFMESDDALLNKAKQGIKLTKKNLKDNLNEARRDYQISGKKSDLKYVKELENDLKDLEKNYKEEFMLSIDSLYKMKQDPAIIYEYNRVMNIYNKTVQRLNVIKKAFKNPKEFLNPDYIEILLKKCSTKRFSPHYNSNFVEMYFCKNF